MDLSVRVEGESDKGRQDTAHMVCSQCAFPLERFSGAQTKLLCPRCNTWLDIDPSCGGSCLSCHKTLRKEATITCTEASDGPTLVNSKENIEEFSQDGVRKKQWTLFSRFAAIVGKARQYLSGMFIL